MLYTGTVWYSNMHVSAAVFHCFYTTPLQNGWVSSSISGFIFPRKYGEKNCLNQLQLFILVKMSQLGSWFSVVGMETRTYLKPIRSIPFFIGIFEFRAMVPSWFPKNIPSAPIPNQTISNIQTGQHKTSQNKPKDSTESNQLPNIYQYLYHIT